MKVPPRFVTGEQPRFKQGEPYRPTFANWLTRSENPYFARAMVNRVWYQFFGRGIVNPVDDMHEGNLPSHPELLEELTAQFVASDFDLKHLVRAICNSQTYQRTSKTLPKEVDPALFASMTIKVMTPEQLYDSLERVLGRMGPQGPAGRGGGAGLPGRGPRAQFIDFFQGSENPDPTEYEDGIPQALRLMNMPVINNAAPVINRMGLAGQPPPAVIEKLYLSTLSRKPTSAEMEKMLGFVRKTIAPQQAYGGILWALLNSSEFRLNH
jgi:hypothetical protein